MEPSASDGKEPVDLARYEQNPQAKTGGGNEERVASPCCVASHRELSTRGEEKKHEEERVSAFLTSCPLQQGFWRHIWC